MIRFYGGLELKNFSLHRLGLNEKRLGGACELFNELVNFSTECVLKLASNLTSQ